jgi:Xanthine dehydrogenase, iron-sulfur cluster and FAD-binding subunit A
MLNSKVEFVLNNKLISIKNLDTNITVLNFLRNEKNLTGTKEGCASGDCGACTAVVGELKKNKIEYKSINTCITFLYTLNGKQLVTIEHLGNRSLHPVQKAMVESDGSQCGFCTPGIVMSMYCMYENKVKPSNDNIDKYLSGNLCRCTGYIPIKKSIKNMYNYKKNKSDQKNIISLLKNIKRNDIMIQNNESRFFVHYNLKGLIKDYQKNNNSYLLVGGTDLALEVTKKRNSLKNIFYLGSNKDLNFINIKKNKIHIGSATPISDIIPKLSKIIQLFRNV